MARTVRMIPIIPSVLLFDTSVTGITTIVTDKVVEVVGLPSWPFARKCSYLYIRATISD